MSNSLTRTAGLKVGPLVLETLIKHYLDHLTKGKSRGARTGNLRNDELLYDEAFTIAKAFLKAAADHTVEEVQRFSNARTPSPPWMHVVRLTIPMSSCDEAAGCLIKALGGEEVANRVVGGTKWWQVRGVKGVDAQWVVVKKDYEEAKKRQKEQAQQQRQQSPDGKRTGAQDGVANGSEGDTPPLEAKYKSDMDDMRCILFIHGGGYYFGSVDQERYCIQRLARKTNGRVFAVSYRLAPQYPFPCPIHDLVAAYLYLIRPPEGAAHCPVNPANIVVAGDSAGGGLAVALLQVIRDSNLPMPAGGILISPWCDLTHCFPSIAENTETDVLPPYGLALHRPSVLWPPPPEEMTTRVHASLRERIRKVKTRHAGSGDQCPSDEDGEGSSPRPVLSYLGFKRHNHNSRPTPHETSRTSYEEPPDSYRGTTASLPEADARKGQVVTITATNGEEIVIKQQIQLYTTNDLLQHPLVSPILSYMGGLPPLLVIAGDKEVLRDEIIYLAHRAAHPDRYPIKDETRKIYPPLEGIENCYGPTQVHFQIYDGAAHVIPILFPFTTPAKYCFRAMATFCKYVTTPQPQFGSIVISPPSSPAPQTTQFVMEPITTIDERLLQTQTEAESVETSDTSRNGSIVLPDPKPHKVTRRNTTWLFLPNRKQTKAPDEDSAESPTAASVGFAGDAAVYSNPFGLTPFVDHMIRERVSTLGVLRPMEPEQDIPACQMPIDKIGVVSEASAKRYISGRTLWDKRFEKTMTSIHKARAHNLDLAKKEPVRNMAQLQMHFFQEAFEMDRKRGAVVHPEKGIKEALQTSASWSWAWAIDGEERPPPSSIVSRRDTEEARSLCRVADQSTTAEDEHMSGNSLWSFAVNFLSLEEKKVKNGGSASASDASLPQEGKQRRPGSRSGRLSRLISVRHSRRPTTSSGEPSGLPTTTI